MNGRERRVWESVIARDKGLSIRSGNVKLTGVIVEELRAMYQSGAYLQRELGQLFGVTQVQVSSIVRGQSWKTG